MQGFPVDGTELAASIQADNFKVGDGRTASVSLRLTARPGYLAALAPARAQLRRQAPQAIEGLPGAWHRLLTATAERRTTTGDLWAPIRSLALAPGLTVRDTKRRHVA